MLAIQILIFLASCSFSTNINITLLLGFMSAILTLILFWICILYFLWVWLMETYKLSLVWFFRINFFIFGSVFCVPEFILILLFSFEVILSKVAILAEPIWVMGFIFMDANTCHFGFAFSMVAVMAHIFCVMLFVQVMTQEHFLFSLGRYFRFVHPYHPILLI